MRKFAVCIVMSTMGALGLFAAEFPYGISMTQRCRQENISVSSLETPVQIVPQDGSTPASDSLAVVKLDNAKITAMDEETWTEAIAAISQTDVQAAFTLKLKDDTTLVWMGYSGGAWLELSGVTPTEDHQWDVKIEFDYSLGANARKIRYLIRPAGNENNENNVDYTPLTHGGSDWIAIGVEKAVIAGVDLYGFGTADAAAAASGARQASGTASGVAECSMDYSDLKLTVTRSSSAADTWADRIQVAVKKNGTALGMVTASLPATGESAVIDLAKELPDIVPGETYDYDVSFAKAYGGVTQTTKIAQASGTIHMFSSVNWFGFNGTGFENATTANITVDGTKFGATDDEQKGVITPDKAADEGQQTIVTNCLTVSSAFPADELTTDLAADAQFAIALATENNVRQWKYFDGGAWQAASSGIPTEDGEYVGTATFDYRDGKKKVTYEIKHGNQTWTLASNVSLGGNTKLNGLDIMGAGFGLMTAFHKTTSAAPVEPEGTTITLESNSKVDLANLDGDYTVESAAGKSFHLRWDDAGNKYAKMDGNTLTVVPGTPANGMKSYDSYVLGLEADESDSKPAVVVKPGVAQKEDQSVFVPAYVPNVEVKTELGHTVQLQLMERLVAGGEWTPSGNPVDISETVNIPIGDNTKLYRVDTIIK